MTPSPAPRRTRKPHRRDSLSTTAEYQCWYGMKHRCSSPRYKGYRRYGGRGISVCDRWLGSFEAFLSDMGTRPSPKHSLDRINNDGNYEPGNCRWATRLQQNRNQRHTTTVERDGRVWAASELASMHGVSTETLNSRLRSGLPVEEALARPVRWKTLTEDDVIDIRTLRAFGAQLEGLALAFGLTKQTIWSVVTYKTYRYVGGGVGPSLRDLDHGQRMDSATDDDGRFPRRLPSVADSIR